MECRLQKLGGDKLRPYDTNHTVHICECRDGNGEYKELEVEGENVGTEHCSVPTINLLIIRQSHFYAGMQATLANVAYCGRDKFPSLR